MQLLAKLFVFSSATLALWNCVPASAQTAYLPQSGYRQTAYQSQVPYQTNYQQTSQVAYRPYGSYNPQTAYLPPALYRPRAYYSQGRPGVYGRTTQTTNNYRRMDAPRTTNQRIGSRLPMAGFGNTARVFGPAGRNGLPPTSLDSFVSNAGGNAERIYGDEGIASRPPYDEFTADHRINAGIVGDRDAGLTTGHGSIMPDAWGNDEFLGQERSMSGANGGNRQNIIDQPPNQRPTDPPAPPPTQRPPTEPPRR